MWRSRTVVGAASDRFYRSHGTAILTALWINTFPFDRGGDLRGLASAAELLRSGHNVLLYPQATRSAGQIEGFAPAWPAWRSPPPRRSCQSTWGAAR